MSGNQEAAQPAQQSQSQRPSHNRNYGSGSSGGGGGGGARPKPPRFQNNNYGNKPPRYQKTFNSRPPPVGHTKKPFPTNNGAVSLRNGFLEEDDSSSTNGPQCCVCYKDSRPFWSVGPCDHPVCLECTVRLRVLVSSNDCAICRASLPEVIFCRSPEPGTFNSLKESGRLRRLTFLPSYGIYLEDDELRVAFDSLLEHRCPLCATSEEANSTDVNFRDFQSLQKHVQRVHSLFACDLCAQNIHLFSNERRFYTRSELATHSRKGGAQGDDKSHRGHPQCEFCDKRFFDPDALYKHLRKDHYFCHFCDADGLNHFYDAYGDLRVHFRKEHFLCEEEACKDEQFTSVFRSEIDMKAHLTAVHSRLLGRHGVKAARVIDVEFNVRPDEDNRRRRFNPRGDRQDNRGIRDRDRDYREDENISHHNMVRSASEPVFEPPALPKPKVDSVAEFPSLDGAAAPSGLSGTTSSSISGIPSVAQKVALASGRNVNNVASSAAATLAPKWNAKSKVDEEFPALGGGPAPMQASKITLTNAVNFKALANATAASSAAQPQVKLPRGPRATREEEFPALGGGSSGGGGGSWGAKVKMKGTPRSLRMAPAPKIERKIQVDNDLTFVPLAVSRAKKDEENLKKLENSSKPEESLSKEKENMKKKKKKEGETSQAQVLAKKADELFNGKNTTSQNSKKGQGKGFDQSNFPALPAKAEKPRESTVAALIEKNPNVAGISVSSSRPPPGFEKSSKSTPADLSFLRDEEEDTVSKFSQNSSSASMWVQPVEFVARSRALTEAIKSSLGGEDEGQTLWLAVMAQFKRGEVSAKEFYGLARDMFGFGDWRVLLPEVVALLPSIPKQQELARVHAREGGNNPPLLNGVGVHLVECKECGQLLRSRGGADLRLHREVAHSSGGGGDFPAL